MSYFNDYKNVDKWLSPAKGNMNGFIEYYYAKPFKESTENKYYIADEKYKYNLRRGDLFKNKNGKIMIIESHRRII